MCSNCAADDFNNPPLTVSTTVFRDVALRPIIRFGQYLARSMERSGRTPADRRQVSVGAEAHRNGVSTRLGDRADWSSVLAYRLRTIRTSMLSDLHLVNNAVAGRPKPRIGIISVSAIADDPRVRRQGDLFADAGWEVVAVGLPGANSPAPRWCCLSIAEDPPPPIPANSVTDRQLSADLRKAAYKLVGLEERSWLHSGFNLAVEAVSLSIRHPAVAVRLARSIFRSWWRAVVVRRANQTVRLVRTATDRAYVETLYWGLNDKFQRLYDLARHESVDMWLANDWTSLPIANRLAREQRVPFAYDTHELAVYEYAQRWSWRLTQRPVIAAIEGGNIKSASFVSCVSAGIGEHLSRFYRLPQSPLVIRNISRYEPIEFRPTGDSISVLYHGVVTFGRGLEACIESVRLWRPDFVFTIRGPGSSEYLDHLVRLAAASDVSDRVKFDPAVPMIELVRAATDHDIGLFALPSHSLQNVYVLPNKLFEYIMAGLALCVSDLPEMARIMREWRVGELIPALSADAIAASINRLDRSTIDMYKRNSLAAARQLNWENEGLQLLHACQRTLSSIRSQTEEANQPCL